jgi:hypothetical protein
MPTRIPPFTASGVLPPYVGASPTVEANRSPYRTDVADLCARFATSAHRVAILQGFLAHRAAINGLGIISGFEWCDGSLVENRPAPTEPGDIDVVIFLRRPATAATDAAFEALVNANLDVFHPARAKAMYHSEAFFVDLDGVPAEQIVARTHYLFGLFSHRRITAEWKGLVQVPLYSPAVDAVAAAALAAYVPPAVHP